MMNSGYICFVLACFIILPVSSCDQQMIKRASKASSSPEGTVKKAATVVESTALYGEDKQEQIAAGEDTTSIDENRKNAITRAVQEVSPAVVSITVTEVVQGGRRVYDRFFNRFFIAPMEREFSSLGSGFIISEDGLVVTNEHVADEDAEKIVVSLPDGTQYKAKVLGTDVLADLALLKIQADRSFPYVEFGNSDQVMVGEWAIAIGNPFGLFKSGQPSVTVGVVSALHRDFRPNPNKPRVYLDMIQTDAAINQGNSGGPLVNSEGKVIGVNTFIYTGGTSSGFVGLGFAIPSNRAKKIIHQLAVSGEVNMTYDLGMRTTPMTYQLVARNNLPAIMGLFVTSVNRDGPAFEGGIMPGDVILEIGDTRVQSRMHAQALFREYQAGDSVRIELLRNNKRYETTILLRRRVSEKP